MTKTASTVYPQLTGSRRPVINFCQHVISLPLPPYPPLPRLPARPAPLLRRGNIGLDNGVHLIQALDSYICNNWHRMRSARFKEMGVDYVSARAEAQVRERTRKRYEVPGAWRQENLEGKATLRAIIDEGSWQRFCQWCRKSSMDLFSQQLVQRIEDAMAQGRLGAEQADNFFNETYTETAVAAAG